SSFASFFGSSVPARCFSRYGPANAFITVTCWSIAKPTSSANGSLASSSAAFGSSVNQSASGMFPILLAENLLERRHFGAERVGTNRVAPARMDRLELGEDAPALVDVARPGRVEQREHADVRLRQPTLDTDRGGGPRAVRRPVALGPFEQPAQLDQRAVALL